MENLGDGAWIAAIAAPWAIAPHPNFSDETVTGPSLLALVAQSRLVDLDQHRSRLSEGHAGWMLELVDAAQRSVKYNTVRSGADDLWILAENETITPGGRIGAALFAAVAEVELDELGVAIERLQSLAAGLQDVPSSKSSALALALLHQQIAARQFELFDYAEAMETLRKIDIFLGVEGEWDAYLVSLGISWDSSRVQDDIHRSITAHSTQLRARMEGFQGTTWVDVVKARSTWPDHRVALAAGTRDRKFVEQMFEQAIGSQVKRRTWSTTDPVLSPALETLLVSELSGDANAFMRGREALAQHRILQILRNPTDDAPWAVQDAIRLFRRARAKDSLKRVLEWIYLQGPEAALFNDASMILERRDFPRDASALDFMVLSWAAQYLSTDMLSRALGGAFEYIRAPKGTPGAQSENERIVWSAIVKLLPGSGKDNETAQVAFDATKQTSSLELVERDFVRLMDLIDWDEVDPDLISAWRTWGAQNVERFAVRDLARRARGLQDTLDHEEIISELTGQDLVLYLVNGNVGAASLTAETLLSADATCIKDLDRTRESASKGTFSYGGVDTGELSIVYAKTYARPAVWDSLTSFLTDPNVPREFKARSLSRVAEYGMEGVPDSVRSSLASTWHAVVASSQVDMFSDPDPRSKFSEALRAGAVLGILSRDEALASATELAGSTLSEERIAACGMLPDVAAFHGSWEWAQLLLLHLTQDADATVRSEAAKQLAFVGNIPTGIRSLVHAAILKALGSGGVRTPLLTLHGLQKLSKDEDWRQYGAEVACVVEALATKHRARVIREAAGHLIAS
ncbi:hypothetical protein FDK12_02060 [Arthrobacter sp. NamB2]|uniref:hypothetical protein n=1 Tax=Arthrobacter sp. NamB2 TaxID=2576035 RepID=UPI0010C9CE72|nr:hypothetical protein [Arthrobacter sp. NamB2]TKV29720.1 hypothetical protein FDK12_02060 [Arthrobacter sp. NamB2]